MELRNAPFLEASRRSSKEGGARSREEYKGAQDAKSVFLVFPFFSVCRGGLPLLLGGRGLLLLLRGGFFWWSSWSGSSARGGLSVERRSVERPVRWSSQSVGSPGLARGTRTGGAALPALSRKPARPSGERRRELAGPVEGPSQPRPSGLLWQKTSRLARQGTTRVQVTCNGLVGPFRSPRLHVIKVYGPCLAPLPLRVVFLSF